MFDIIVAVSKNNIIGVNNDIPWNYKEDMSFFKKITTSNGKKNIIIMGYNTWISIGRVLPNRINIVINRDAKTELDKIKNNLYYSNNFNNLLIKIRNEFPDYSVFVIGGEKIYNEALKIIIAKMYF